jgi:hypothetical protein
MKTPENSFKRHCLLACARAIARAGSLLETALWGNRPPAQAPVFILGLPRSGSTLIYQSICHAFQTANPKKLGLYLWFTPALAAWIIKRLAPPYSSDFKSDYGLGKSLASPFCGNAWNLWLGRDSFVDSQNIPPSARREITRSVGRIERIFGQPFVDKNQRFNQWVGALATLFPKATFLVCVRNPSSTAFSILRARYELYGSFDTWFLKQPRSFRDQGNQSPEHEVAYQIRGILEDLKSDMLKAGPDRFAVVEYETFCENPRASAQSIQAFLKTRGVHLKEQNQLPESFKVVSSSSDRLSDQQTADMLAAVQEAFPDNEFRNFPCQIIGSP